MNKSKQPRCFSSLQVSDKSAKCSNCPHRVSCADGAYSFLEPWRGAAVIDADRQRIALVARKFRLSASEEPVAIEGAKPAPQPQPAPAAHSGNKTVKRSADRAETSGKFALYARELAQGRNPGKKAWEIVFFDLLLQGNMTRKKLVRTYIEDERTRFTSGSARTRACTAIAMFEQALFIREDDGLITIHPHIGFNNTSITQQRQV